MGRQMRKPATPLARLACALLAASLLLAPAKGAPPRRALLASEGAEEQEPAAAAHGASLADGDPLPGLPSGKGPLYSTTATIVASLERWAAASSGVKGRMSLLKIGDPLNLPPGSPRGSPSYGAALTAARFTDASAPAEGKRRAVLTCSTHARELITGETCFALVRLLAGAEDGVAAAAASSSSAVDADPAAALWRWREMREAMRAAGLITRAESASAASASAAFRGRVAPRVARELDLAILPVVNQAGRDAIEKNGSYQLRKAIDARDPKNRPQVDPNRSYPFKWERSFPGSQQSETFSGDNEAWPWEVRAVASLLANDEGGGAAAAAAAGPGAKKQLDAAVDVHSGIHALLFPYGHTCDLSGLSSDRLDLWQRASEAGRGAWGDIVVGPTSAALYVAKGTTMEYAYGALGAPLSATPEIYNGAGDGKHQACPVMAEWASACSGSGDGDGWACACAAGEAPAVACRSTVAAREEEEQQGGSGGGARRRAGSMPRFGGGELTPAEVLLEAQILRHAAAVAGNGGDVARVASAAERAADAAERETADALGTDVPSARAAARAYWGAARYDGEVDPAEAESAHYQPGKWPAGVTPGVDLADAVQMGEPVRAAGEQWYARDPYLRHWPAASRGERGTFSFFNPTSAADYRRTVSDYSAGLLAMLLTPAA